jgi:DDE superfamily endonuclease
MWCIPPQEDARFVAAMEDVLDVYERPYDAQRPVVCLDEAAKQILGEVRDPLPLERAQPLRYDNQYERHGTCALFMLFEPLASWRAVIVRERRTMQDYAHVVRYLCDEKYPDAEKIILVQDNLNTHGVWSLYEAFEPAEAHRLAQRIEWHHTPKHGSWLNMAEIELSVLARQCLRERMETQQQIEEQVHAWQQQRNLTRGRVEWRFTVQDARCKLKRLYPKLLPG